MKKFSETWNFAEEKLNERFCTDLVRGQSRVIINSCCRIYVSSIERSGNDAVMHFLHL